MAASSTKKKKKVNKKVRNIILISIAAVAAAAGTLTYLDKKAKADDELSIIKSGFSSYYPTTFDTVEVIEADGDRDGDNLTNAEESDLGTNVFLADTDADGIIDSLEEKYGTDPLNPDTDGDGVKDGDEVQALGLDPLSPTSGGSAPDKERRFNIERVDGDCTLRLIGNASIYSSTFGQLSLNAVASNAGALSFAYELWCEDSFDHAELVFKYNSALVKSADIDKDSIKVFRFDPYSEAYVPIGGTVNEKNSTVTCSVTENGVYVLGADVAIQQSAVTEESPLNIHLLIDNSGSMYPKKYISTSAENDVDFKRLTFASKFVSELESDANVAVSAFTYDYKEMCGFTDDKSKMLQAINEIRGLGPGFDGTSVERAIMLGLKSFTAEMRADRNIIIILTDGISTSTAGYTLDDITESALAKNVTIMTISLGDEYDRELLSSIADRTGGKYFQISEANILEGLYSPMIASVQYDIVDDNLDGKPDSYTLFDTGFDAELNGFSFKNFKSMTSGTLDFGMCMLARDWFRSVVPNEPNTEDKNLKYSFTDAGIDVKRPLSEVRMTCLDSEFMDPNEYLDFEGDGAKLKIKSEVLLRSRQIGWSVTTMPFSAEGREWTEAELLVPDHVSGMLGKSYTQADYQMLRALNYYDSFRDSGKTFVLSSENDLDKVKEQLGTGTPLVMKMIWNDNGVNRSRYVLLTTLRRSLDDPNMFKLKIYDVHTGSAGDVTLIRTPTAFPGKNGVRDYTYSADWDGRQVSLSFSLAEAK